MVIERKWKTWVFFYIPLTVFVIGTLFPFYWMLITAIRPDAELYRSWRAATNTPFWTLQPTLEHFRDLMAKRRITVEATAMRTCPATGDVVFRHEVAEVLEGRLRVQKGVFGGGTPRSDRARRPAGSR